MHRLRIGEFMRIIQMDNGFKILYKPMANTHSVTIGLYVRAGIRYENAWENGITHLLEHLHFRQLYNMSQNELYYSMESIGSTLKACTYSDFLKFSMKICPQYFNQAIKIFKNILLTYKWSEDSFKNEICVVKKQIDEKNASYSNEQYIKESLFGDDPLSKSIMGTESSISNISLSNIIDFKKSVFVNNNMLLCITGCLSDSNIKYTVEEFEKIEIFHGEKLTLPHPPKCLNKRKPNIIFYNDSWNYMDVEIAFDIDYETVNICDLKVLNCILGEGVGSRLQKCIRERFAFTTNVYSEPELFEDFAILHIKFSVSKSQLFECLVNVFGIISEIKTSINAQDLNVTIPFYVDNRAFLEDDTETMNFEIAYNYFILENHTVNFNAENNEDYREKLMDIAKKVFIPANTSVILFGNCNHITKKAVRDIISIL